MSDYLQDNTSLLLSKRLSPSIDTEHSNASISEFSVISDHANLVAGPLSPLQDHSSTPAGPASASEWEFIWKEKFKEGSTLSKSIRPVQSISADDCDYPAESGSPVSIQTASCDQAVMPYNNTAITPSEEITGSTSLPLARVKRILQADEEILPVSNSAGFAVTVATEIFVRYLTSKAFEEVKAERKPRRNIQYKDVANAVARFDNLEFLSDVVPKTMKYGEFKRRKAEKDKRKAELQNGQTTLNASRALPKRQTEVIDVDKEFPDEQDEAVHPSINGDHGTGPSHINGTGDMMEEHETNDDSRHGGSEDVDMD